MIVSIEVYKFFKINLLPLEEELNVKICIVCSPSLMSYVVITQGFETVICTNPEAV